jgi:Zn-dependent protease
MAFEPAAAAGVALGFASGLIAHEFSTHVVAARMGDPSPRFQGRLTLDLRRHADMLGTYVAPTLFIVVTLFGSPPNFYFAYAKPHALQAGYQRGPAQRVIISALAGPIAMLLVALMFARLAGVTTEVGVLFFYASITLVHMVAVELLPMPGRDGGRILARFLSPQAAMKMDELRQYEALFVVAVYLLFPGVVRSIAEPFFRLISF